MSTWIDAGPRGVKMTTGNKLDLSGPTLRVVDGKGDLKFEVALTGAEYAEIANWAFSQMKGRAK